MDCCSTVLSTRTHESTAGCTCDNNNCINFILINLLQASFHSFFVDYFYYKLKLLHQINQNATSYMRNFVF